MRLITNDDRIKLNLQRMIREYMRESEPIVRQMCRLWDVSIRTMRFNVDGTIEYLWENEAATIAYDRFGELLEALKRTIQNSYIRSGLLPYGDYWPTETIDLPMLHPSMTL